MPRILTEQHKMKLALGREKALANRQATAKAKQNQKDLDFLELKKHRASTAYQLERLKNEKKPIVGDLPAKSVVEALEEIPGSNQLAVDNVNIPEEEETEEPVKKVRKRKKKKIVVLETESSDEDIVVVRAPRRKKKVNVEAPPVNVPAEIPVYVRPREPTAEEVELKVRERRQEFLTSVMGDRWR
tara:strand:+ start:721 stop:1278 length:558 start_codon:yes stop_codon:yes gene_type:complete